jgi:hypothetical protein
VTGVTSRVVAAPDGTQWTVRVVWVPRWRALARRFGGWRHKRKRKGVDVDPGDAASGVLDIGSAGDEILVVVVIFIGVILAAVLFWWVLLPLLLVVLDLLIVLILLAVGVVARVLFRRPWTVEATAEGAETIQDGVVGWRAALRRRDELAEQLRAGTRPALGVASDG